MPRAEITGWVGIGEEVKRVIPTKCPICGGKVHRTDASRLCGIIFVYCDATHMRISHWGKVYES